MRLAIAVPTNMKDSRLLEYLHFFLLMTTIRVKENEPFEVALRRFKRTIEKIALLPELRAREFREKPTAMRKRKKQRRSSAISSGCAVRCCRKNCIDARSSRYPLTEEVIHDPHRIPAGYHSMGV